MTVDTRQISNRRQVRYADFDEFQADVERVVRGPARTVGNWTVAQIFDHLAKSMNTAVDGPPVMFPLLFRLAVRPFRNRIIAGPLRPGFKLPKRMNAVFMPSDGAQIQEAFEKLTAALSRFRQAKSYGPHPAFGVLSPEQWNTLTLNHNALHMSFIVLD